MKFKGLAKRSNTGGESFLLFILRFLLFVLDDDDGELTVERLTTMELLLVLFFWLLVVPPLNDVFCSCSAFKARNSVGSKGMKDCRLLLTSFGVEQSVVGVDVSVDLCKSGRINVDILTCKDGRSCSCRSRLGSNLKEAKADIVEKKKDVFTLFLLYVD